MIFICERTLSEKDLLEKALGGSRHILHSLRPGFQEEHLSSQKLEAAPQLFFEKPLSFVAPLAPQAPQTFSFSQDLTSSLKKAETLKQLEKQMVKAGCRTSLIEDALTCADEMILNAFFHAPVDANGRSTFKNFPRSEEVKTSEGKSVHFEASMQDSLLFLGCRDDFGSLKLSPVLEHLLTMYQSQGLPMTTPGTMGAGLGLKMILDRSSSFWIYVQPGVHTWVYGSFETKPEKPESKKMKTLHFFEGAMS